MNFNANINFVWLFCGLKSEFMDFLTTYKDIFEKYMANQGMVTAPKNLYLPMEYIMNLPGKRIRPVLVMLAASAFDTNSVEKALPAAMAVEVFHNFSLVHDDIMDAAPLRRGLPAVHKKYGTNNAILTGDVMLIKAYQYLMQYEGELAMKLLTIFNKMAQEVCEGQQYDVDFETREDVTIPEYIKMIEYKTSVLIAACMQMGALIGGASDQDAQHLYNYGVNVGIAFQMQDDVLDTFGTPKVGKQAAGDIIQNKKTYLFLKALELSTDKDKETLLKWYSQNPEDPTEKIDIVKKLFKDYNVLGYTEEVKMAYKDLALSHLTPTNMDEKNKQIFVSFADFLLNRDV